MDFYINLKREREREGERGRERDRGRERGGGGGGREIERVEDSERDRAGAEIALVKACALPGPACSEWQMHHSIRVRSRSVGHGLCGRDAAPPAPRPRACRGGRGTMCTLQRRGGCAGWAGSFMLAILHKRAGEKRPPPWRQADKPCLSAMHAVEGWLLLPRPPPSRSSTRRH